jgi:hypothetical protein
MHRRRQDGVGVEEPAALRCREIIFVSHDIGSSRYCLASLRVGRRAEIIRTALLSSPVLTQVCTTTSKGEPC